MMKKTILYKVLILFFHFGFAQMLPREPDHEHHHSNHLVTSYNFSALYFDHYCNDKPETGKCRGYFEKWYFDTESGVCKTFFYGGCDGNKNNFATQGQCEKSCQIFEKNQMKTVSK